MDKASRENVDQLHVRITNHEAASSAYRDSNLQLQPHALPAGRDHFVETRHRVLHGERARRRAQAVVAVDPAGDRIAAEVDDATTEAVELGNERVKDAVQVCRDHLGAAL